MVGSECFDTENPAVRDPEIEATALREAARLADTLATASPEQVLQNLLERERRRITLERQVEDLRKQPEIRGFHDLVLDQIQDHITLTDLEGLITYVNEAECRSLKRPRSELIGQSIITYGEDVSRGASQREIIEETLAHGAWRGEVVNRAADGGEIIFDCRTRVVRDDQGRPLALCGIATDITDRKRSEEALRQSEERFRAIADYTVDWESWFGPDGEYLWVNPSVKEITGYAPEEILAMPDFISVLVAEEDRERFLARFQEAIHGSRGENFEFRYVRRDGTKRWLSASWQPIYDRQGRPLGTRASGRDITDRRDIEEALRKSESRFRSLVTASSNPILVLQNRRYVYANPASLDLLGYTQEELGAMDALEVIDPAQRHLVSARMEKAEAGQPNTPAEMRIIRKDGTCLITRSASVPIEFGGQPAALITSQDITELKRAQEALEAGERRYRHLVENISDVIFEIDHRGFITYVSPVGRTLWGGDLEEILGRNFMELIHPEDRGLLDQRYAELRQGIVNPALYRFVNRTGEVLWVRSFTRPIFEQGQFRGAVGTLIDLTVQRRAEETLRRSEALLAATQRLTRVGGWEWDVTEQIMTWSEETYRLHDYQSGQFEPGSPEHIAKSLACYRPEDRSMIENAFKRCVEQGEPYDLEVPFTTARGRHLWIRTTAEPVLVDGKVSKVIGNIMDITDRKEVEARQCLMVEMLDQAPGSITVHDTEGRFLYANQKTFELHGTSRDAFMAINLHDLDVPETEALLAERFREIAEFGQASFQVAHYHRDGHPIPLEVFAKTVDWQGRPAVLSIATDISERKKAEENLRRSEARYRAAAEAGLDSLFIFHSRRNDRGGITDFIFDDVNRRGEEMLQMRREQLIGRGMLEVLPENRDLGFFEKYKRVVDTGIPLEEEFYLPNTHVPAAWHSHQVVPLGDGIAISHRVITDRKRAEQELADREEYLRTILQTTVDGFLVFNGEGRLVEVNQAYCTLSGYSRDELLQRHVNEIDALEDPLKTGERIQRIIESGSERFEVRHRTRDGRILDLEMSITYLNRDGGRFIGFCRDITDRKRAEERLRRTLEEKEVLLREVHHRVKNNLNVISSLLNLQSSIIQTPEQALAAFRNSRDRIRAMARVHEELYQSRDTARVDINLYLNKLGREIKDVYDGGNAIRLTVEVDEIFLNVNQAVPCGLIVNELVTNAVKHAFPEGAAGEVRISCQWAGDEGLELFVQDDGRGLPEDFREDQDTSLGFTLVRLLTEQIDGTLEILREKGTGFRIRFPLKE